VAAEKKDVELKENHYSMQLGLQPFKGKVVECFAKAIASWPRPWLMLIGDSNLRKLFEYLFKKFNTVVDGGEPFAFTNKTRPGPGFDPRWFDSDAIFLIKNKPFRISIRFMWNANSRLRSWGSMAAAGTNWYTKIFSCGARDDSWENPDCPQSPHPAAFFHYRS